MSASQQGGLVNDEEELERVAALVVRHVLFKHHSHESVPVPREELVKVIQEQYPQQRGVLPRVIPRAQRLFKDVLGFDLLDATFRPPNSSTQEPSQQSLGSAKAYILRSRLSQDILKDYVLRDDTAQHTALRLMVCAVIEGGGGSIPEDDLWSLLGKMGLKKTSSQHPAFGNVAEAFKSMERAKFIVLKKGRGDEDEGSTVELGPRAHIEFPGDTLKTYFEKVCEGTGVQ